MTKVHVLPIIEAIVFTSICLGIRYYLDPLDPIGLNESFPWVWLLPVIFALQYRYPAALCSAAVIVGFSSWAGINFLESTPHKLFIVGGGILTLICAHYSGKWQSKIQILETTTQYFEQKCQELHASFATLAISHHELEQKYITDQKSLRGALESLKSMDKPSMEEHAMQFLQILSFHCTITKGGIVDASGKMIAQIGQLTNPDMQDPLVKYSVTAKQLVHVVHEQNALLQSRYRIVKRLRHGSWDLYLLIEEIPFIFFNTDNLALMDILCDYWTHLCLPDDHSSYESLLPHKLLSELAYLKSSFYKHNLESHLLCIKFGRQEVSINNIESTLLQSKRGLDSLYIWDEQHQITTALFLLPFANETITAGFLKRIKSILDASPNIEYVTSIYPITSFEPKDWEHLLNEHA